MTQILDALTRGFRDLFQLKILWVVVWPVLVAVFLWLVLGLIFREPISGLFESGLAAIGF